MNKNRHVIKRIFATTLAANLFVGGCSIFNSENVASAWFFGKKHTVEEIDALYNDNDSILQGIKEDAKNLDDLNEAGLYIKEVSALYGKYSEPKTYENAIELQSKLKSLVDELEVSLSVQEVERRRKAEEAEQEQIRLENEHRRKLEEAAEQHKRDMEAQKLQMDKEERERLEQIENVKASLSEKVFSVKRKALKDIELDENVARITSLYEEIENKIQAIDNLNRVDGVEVLIDELKKEIEVVLDDEEKLRQEKFEKTLNEAKENLLVRAEELENLLLTLDENDESCKKIKARIESSKDLAKTADNLVDINVLQHNFDEFSIEINYLLELKDQQEEERRKLEELENEIESFRDPQKLLEKMTDGKVTLDDVIGGNKNAKAKASALLKAFEKYNKGGKFEPSKGLLLYGPPGTGKTSFVTAFAATNKLEIFIVTPSLVMGDNGERKVLEIIEQARKAAQISGEPVILLIDEIDAIAQKRSGDETNKVLVMLMNEIDKLKASDNVIVFAREALDRAIVRSGRLDQSVEVGYPNAEDKEKIINIYLKHFKVDEDINIKSAVEKMKRFSGADIKRAIDIAINSAMDRQEVETFATLVITNSDLQKGVATVMDEKMTVY